MRRGSKRVRAIAANVFGPEAEGAGGRGGDAGAVARVRVVDFFWADPDPRLVELAHVVARWRAGRSAHWRRR